ncbi:MAG: VapC toxin family PIN domain ribonuclease [Syntrophobacterales bacterium CG_4_8_14_3_um_filter_49_14]|nr:MAG: VapC toxin family PIN domain ribonuclease [Syntrophobacterales bacterium CG23_combo_of_CG06-09_8_20_14_all_48_27]PJC73995.1 MAG: VapC toxin family PIN domain ribonuclease [Syntrophobacterales bacterium CG_4_8_14_3_um_filter_49_14]
MLVALDTNILAYAEGIGDSTRCGEAIRLIERLPAELVLLPAQSLGELFRVLTGKAKREQALARQAIMNWADSFEVADSSWAAFQAAMDLTIDHRIQIWDALIMAVAAENSCRMLLSEDLQNGFIWRGVTVVNPFAAPSSPLLDNILKTR